MGNEVISAIALTVLLFAGFGTAGLLVYHFLVFDNFQGFIEDLSFYQQDDQSAHFLYWFFFWSIIIFSGILAKTQVKTK